MPELLEMAVMHQSDFMTVSYCETNKLMCGKWVGNISSDILRKEMLFTCEFILENKVELILTDYSYLHPPTVSDQAWIAETTTKKLVNSTIRRIASIQSVDLIQQQVMDSIVEKSRQIEEHPWEYKTFISPKTAVYWLLTGEDLS